MYIFFDDSSVRSHAAPVFVKLPGDLGVKAFTVEALGSAGVKPALQR